MGNAGVGPVEVQELAVDAGDVAEVQVAVDERRRDAARGEPAADLLERRHQPAQLGDLAVFQEANGDRVVQQRFDLPLEHVEPAVETAVGEELVRNLAGQQLQPGEAP